MVECPRCHYQFPLHAATRTAFERFHALRDEYAAKRAYSKVYAKDELCVLFGVAIRCNADLSGFEPPKWPGVFVRIWTETEGNQLYFRKSTLQYTEQEMADLTGGTLNAIYETA